MTGEQRDHLRGRLILNLKVWFVRKCRRSGCDARDTNSMTGYQRHVPVYTCSQSSSSCFFERAAVSFEPCFWSFGIIRVYQHTFPQLCATKCWSHFWRYRSRTWVVDEPGSLPIGTGFPDWVAPWWRHHRMLSVDCRTQKVYELTVSRTP